MDFIVTQDESQLAQSTGRKLMDDSDEEQLDFDIKSINISGGQIEETLPSSPQLIDNDSEDLDNYENIRGTKFPVQLHDTDSDQTIGDNAQQSSNKIVPAINFDQSAIVFDIPMSPMERQPEPSRESISVIQCTSPDGNDALLMLILEFPPFDNGMIESPVAFPLEDLIQTTKKTNEALINETIFSGNTINGNASSYASAEDLLARDTPTQPADIPAPAEAALYDPSQSKNIPTYEICRNSKPIKIRKRPSFSIEDLNDEADSSLDEPERIVDQMYPHANNSFARKGPGIDTESRRDNVLDLLAETKALKDGIKEPGYMLDTDCDELDANVEKSEAAGLLIQEHTATSTKHLAKTPCAKKSKTADINNIKETPKEAPIGIESGRKSSRSKKSISYAPPPLDPLQDPMIIAAQEETARCKSMKADKTSSSTSIISEGANDDDDDDSDKEAAEEFFSAPVSSSSNSAKAGRGGKTVKNAKGEAVIVENTPTSSTSSRKRKVSSSASARSIKKGLAADTAEEILANDTIMDEITTFVGRNSRASSRTSTPSATNINTSSIVVVPDALECRIMFTGLEPAQYSKKIPAMERLGAIQVENWVDCSHLVTDKVRRTVKFLCALSAGKHIVSLSWLDACKKEGKLVDESNFLLHDETAQNMYGFDLSKSLKVAQSGIRLLEGYKFYATPSVRPERNDLREILVAAGASLTDKIPKKATNDTIIVIGSENDDAECKKLAGMGLHVQKNEFLFSGILRQHLDLERYIFEILFTTRHRIA